VSTFEKVLLAIILIEIPIHWDVYLDQNREEFALGALGGLNVSVTTVCLALLYGAWLPRVAIRRIPLSANVLRAILPAIVYAAVVGVAALGAYSVKLSLFELFLLAQAFLLLLYIVRRVRTEQDVRFVVTLMLAVVVVESLIMLGLRFVVGHSLDILHWRARIDASGRVEGTLGSANTAASYFVVMLPVVLGVLLTEWPARYRMLAVLALFLGAVGLVLTMSRGGWLSAAMALTFLCVAAWRRGRLSLLVPAALLLSGLSVFLLFSQMITERLSQDDRGAALSRLPLMSMSFRMFEAAPLLGVGPNNQTVAMRPYAQSAAFRGGFIYVVHNRYLQVMVETGIVGLLAFLFFLLSTLRCGWRAWIRDTGNLSAVALGLTAGLLGVLIHMNMDTFSGRFQVQQLWLVAGLMIALARLTAAAGGRQARAQTC
jgi:O-antigen ligase